MFRNLSIYNVVSREKADKALKDAEELIEFIHARSFTKVGDHNSWFTEKALEYPLAFATSVARRT
jgi:hypothetical protein